MNKKITIAVSLIVIIAILAVISFLIVKSVGEKRQVVNENQNANQNVNENVQVNNEVIPVNYYEVKEPEKNNCSDDLDTACWKTLRNKEYNFEIMIPNNWVINNEKIDTGVKIGDYIQSPGYYYTQFSKYIIINNPENSEMKIGLVIQDNTENKKLDDLNLCEKTNENENILSCENVFVDNTMFNKKIYTFLNKTIKITAIKNNKIFTLTGISFGVPEEIDVRLTIIDKIFSTINFVG